MTARRPSQILKPYHTIIRPRLILPSYSPIPRSKPSPSMEFLFSIGWVHMAGRISLRILSDIWGAEKQQRKTLRPFLTKRAQTLALRALLRNRHLTPRIRNSTRSLLQFRTSHISICLYAMTSRTLRLPALHAPLPSRSPGKW